MVLHCARGEASSISTRTTNGRIAVATRTKLRLPAAGALRAQDNNARHFPEKTINFASRYSFKRSRHEMSRCGSVAADVNALPKSVPMRNRTALESDGRRGSKEGEKLFVFEFEPSF